MMAAGFRFVVAALALSFSTVSSQVPVSLDKPLTDVVAPFDCNTYNGIIQVHHDSSANAYYKVSRLDVATGNYVEIYPINSTDWIPDGGGDGADKVNSVALYHDTAADKYYPFAAIGGGADDSELPRFCAFDNTQLACVDVRGGPNSLKIPGGGTNLGVISGTTYYYSVSGLQPGVKDAFFLVKDIDTTSPSFTEYTDAPLKIDRYLFAENRGPADVVVLQEEPGQDDLVEDGEPGGTYFVGVTKRDAAGSLPSLFITKLAWNAAIGADDPVKYAILDAEFDWGGHTVPVGVSGFGGAYAFKEGGVTKAYVTANEGWGLFEIGLPLKPDTTCWNSGAYTRTGGAPLWPSTHTACGSTTMPSTLATLTRRMHSEYTVMNDGMNCPEGFPLSPEPTALPLPAPTALPLPAPTAAPNACSFTEMDTCGEGADETLHKYANRACCCEDMDPAALDTFIGSLDVADSAVSAACAHHGFS
jgi:hypothetical protein